MENPTVLVALSYDTLWDDFDTFDVKALVSTIPYKSALKFLIEKLSKVYYSFGDYKTNKDFIYEYRCYMQNETQITEKIDKFLIDQPYPVVITNEGALLFCQLLLQCGHKTNEERNLTPDEIRSFYKALLYCNKLWLDVQQNGIQGLNLTLLSLKIDVPYSEFKYNKDFKPALYKCRIFLEFCNNNKTLQPYVDEFLKERGVDSTANYILSLFLPYYDSIQTWTLSNMNELYSHFCSNYLVDLNNCANLWDDKKQGLLYLRNHFLIKLNKDKLLLLNPGLLIDKMYQGLAFDLWNIINKSTINPNTQFKDFPTFRSFLGENFSEKYLLYNVLQHCFTKDDCVKLSGEELKSKGVVGEPDFYIREGHNVFLFEYKDILFPDRVKFGGDADNIRSTILDRICKDNGKVRKGVGQLLETISNIVLKHSMDSIDKQYEEKDLFFPIVVTTDKAYDSLGVNKVIIEDFPKIIQANHSDIDLKKVHIALPVIVDLDDLIVLMYKLHTGELSFKQLVQEYTKQFSSENPKDHLPSFSNLVREKLYGLPFTKDENQYIFQELMRDIENNTKEE